MIIHHDQLQVSSHGGEVTFHDVTDHVKQTIKACGVKNGLAAVYSQHTTCSVMLQEESHDATYHGTKFLLQDLLNIFEKIIPRCRHEGQYLHPGAQHIDHATKNLGEEAVWSLNTDAHLRSCLMGRSETIPIVNGQLQLGEFGQIYFIDFDTVRARTRMVRVQIIGE